MTSIDTLLTDHLDLWTSAIARKSSAGRGRSKKFSLYGIDKLRALILDLAVRGKLVPQDPEDEPASELLKRWKSAKKLALENTKDRRIRSAPEPASFSVNLPTHWLTQSFENIFLFIDYRGNTPPKTDSGIPLITAKNVRMGYLDREPQEFVSESTFENWMTRGFPDLGDLFFTTEAPLGNICLNDIEEPFAIAQRLICFNPYGKVNTRFYMLVIMSDVMQRIIDQNSTGMTASGIKAAKLKPIALPVPPEAEQYRIVAKVDELMALCDRLEVGTFDEIEAHQLLVAELLAALTTNRDDGVADNWARIEAHFDTLFTTEDSVEQLRQTILQLAMVGRLVRQDPKDEPASELLKRIKVDWLRQVSERGMRGAKVPTFLARDVENYSYPETWKLVPLGQLSLVADPNPSHRYPDYNGGTIPLLSTQEFSGEDGWDHSTAKLTTEAFWQFQQEICAFDEGDIIFARKGRLGLPRFLPPFDRYTFSHTLFVIKPMSGVDPNYLLWFLRRRQTVDWLTNEMNQNTGVPTLGKAKTERLPVPLPPLGEQKRIVAKIEKLMDLCDALKSRLGQIDENAVQFADAIVAKAVA